MTQVKTYTVIFREQGSLRIRSSQVISEVRTILGGRQVAEKAWAMNAPLASLPEEMAIVLVGRIATEIDVQRPVKARMP